MGQSLISGLDLDLSSMFLLFVTVCAFMIPVVVILPPIPLSKSDALLQTHSKAGVKPAKSNLRDQHAAEAHALQPGHPARIHSLVVYPVKSCRGIEVTRSRVFPQGLEFDRLFTFAQLKSPFPAPVQDAGAANATKNAEEEKSRHRWEFITQRQFARLATVKVDLWQPDEMKLRKQSLRTREAFLTLRFPWRGHGWRGVWDVVTTKLGRGVRAEPEREILLPVDFPSEAEIRDKGYAYEEVRIWKDTATALNMERDLPEELRLYLGVSNKLGLFRIDPARLREVYRCAPRKEAAGYQPVTGFQDAYPLHMLNLSSVQKFSSEVPKDQDLKQLDVLRFRANMMVSGAPAYDEETWKRARFKPGTSGLYNDAVFHVSCRTVRCKMPNVDPTSGDRHPREPDKSLRALRAVDEGAPLLGCLGMQLTPLFEDSVTDDQERAGWVAVGMTVEVEERGEHVYIKQ
ncbi:Uu.00g017320.m01.CDS01 [Anthostomella pinea]|uniref:Uu.00g017320.m01.CDS01 n=1 Tax=Anthostomella pinea TaxID=933095 RepID=A0AAI8VYW1_9PEZI|nr:Uu.00g017320.m01.CDS01 [Anthostomella pinea]